jgi:hypothetical protein
MDNTTKELQDIAMDILSIIDDRAESAMERNAIIAMLSDANTALLVSRLVMENLTGAESE